MKSTDIIGATVLHHVAYIPESLKAILELLPADISSEVLYSIEHPYQHFLYEHRRSIAMLGMASLAGLAYCSFSTTEREEFNNTASGVMSSLICSFNSLFSAANGGISTTPDHQEKKGFFASLH